MTSNAETKRTMRLHFRFVLLTLVASLAVTLPALAGAAAQQTPTVGTPAGAIDLRAVSGAVPYGSGWAIPLEGAKPSWLTPELEQQVIAAEGTPVAAPT